MTLHVTKGQALLAHGYAQDLCDEIYMAMIGTEGAENRERHVEAAKRDIDRILELLGMVERDQEAA